MRNHNQSIIRRLVACSLMLLFVPAIGYSNDCCTPGTALERGYRAAYNLDFDTAQHEFSAWQKAHPEDPLGPVSEAAGLLFSEFNRLGILESQLFTHDSNFEKRKKQTPDPAIRSRFEAALSRADALAAVKVARDPKDVDALFAQALSNGLRADYTALVEKRNVASLGYTRDANAAAKKLLAIDPEYYDAYLATGINNYIIGSLSAPVRWFMRLGGYEGDKKTGIDQLRLAAEHGRFFAPFARMLLAVAYLRDKDTRHARELLSGLHEQFPANPLFAREMARLERNHGGGQ